jgi:DNA-binding Lrp family transcriptional regulator
MPAIQYIPVVFTGPGDDMGKISLKTKLKGYYRIYEQIHANPTMPTKDIGPNAGISRNTVAKYIKEMYRDHILVGPYLQVYPVPTYKQYVYLVDFTDPLKAFCGLKGFPHVVYHALTSGDWNTMVITDRLLDVTQLVGFEKVVTQGVRYCSYTPKVELKTWGDTFQDVYRELSQFKRRPEYKIREVTPSTWQENEWKLYYAFKYIRRPVTPVLQKISVKYEHYMEWKSDLYTHCSVHTGFYPGGYDSYLDYCFLFSTDYEESVKSVFSLFPTTPFFMEVDKHLLTFIQVNTPEVQRNLLCLIHNMQKLGMIKHFKQASTLFHYSVNSTNIKPSEPSTPHNHKVNNFKTSNELRSEDTEFLHLW